MNFDPDQANLDRTLLNAAVRDAGKVALGYFRTGARSWEKRPDDPVSEADIAVDRLLHGRLRTIRPQYGWLSEESPIEPAVPGQPYWAIDPIDGTKAFLRQKPEFCVSAALVADGTPWLAAIFNPATDEFFEAMLGQGAKLNSEPIRLKYAGDPPGEGGRPLKLLASKRTFERHGWLRDWPDTEFHYVHSIAYRMALVAAGRFDATLSMTEKSDWDVAAADLVIQEAGGICTAPNGAALRYSPPGENQGAHRLPGVLAAAPALHRRLRELLAPPPRGGES
jgi:myo-inositol-1(or 4)-monophosphatase